MCIMHTTFMFKHKYNSAQWSTLTLSFGERKNCLCKESIWMSHSYLPIWKEPLHLSKLAFFLNLQENGTPENPLLCLLSHCTTLYLLQMMSQRTKSKENGATVEKQVVAKWYVVIARIAQYNGTILLAWRSKRCLRGNDSVWVTT